jgi:hypothetical protein
VITLACDTLDDARRAVAIMRPREWSVELRSRSGKLAESPIGEIIGTWPYVALTVYMPDESALWPEG